MGKTKIIGVTNIVKIYFAQGKTVMLIGNQLFTDPCPRIIKELTITLTTGKVKILKENISLTLSQIIS